MVKTFIIPKKFIIQNWYIINAENQILGRLASQISQLLLNKYTKIYTPFMTPVTNIIIINSDKIMLTHKKSLKKFYLNYSGYQGGLHFKKFLQIKYTNSEKIIQHAIKKMLPKTLLSKKQFSKLFIYKNIEHFHYAQSPILTPIHIKKK